MVHERIDRVARFANGDGADGAPGHASQGHAGPGHSSQSHVAAAPEAADQPEEQILTVGKGIRLSAEMCECDILFVEGELKAKAQSKVLRIAKGGIFQGDAQVEHAEIAGTFKGHLDVTKRLTIRGSGVCSGDVRYGEILVDAGGRIAGELNWRGDVAQTSAPHATATPQMPTMIAAPQETSAVITLPPEPSHGASASNGKTDGKASAK